jgi:hypothetical protein
MNTLHGPIRLVFFILTVTAINCSAATVVLNFDDIPVGWGLNPHPMPEGYGGLSWSTNVGAYRESVPPYNIELIFDLQSLRSAAGGFASFLGGPEVFDGAYFTGSQTTVQFNLYSGGELVATSSVLSVTSTPTFLPSNYSGPIDTVGVVGYVWDFEMDNFTYETIPEPSGAVLLAAWALAAAMRFRQRHNPSEKPGGPSATSGHRQANRFKQGIKSRF